MMDWNVITLSGWSSNHQLFNPQSLKWRGRISLNFDQRWRSTVESSSESAT